MPLHPLTLLHPQMLPLLMWGFAGDSVNSLCENLFIQAFISAALILYVQKRSEIIQFSVNLTLDYSGNGKKILQVTFLR